MAALQDPVKQPAGLPAEQMTRRILVVDDNRDAAETLAEWLKSYGHEVVAAFDGERALQAYKHFHPQIVLLDIGMPGMGLLEIARRLREGNGALRPLMVALTGWGKQKDEIISKEAGFDLHIVKPIEKRQLQEILGRAAGLLH